jgi:hypothetical protein
VSTDNGTRWNAITDGLTNTFVVSFAYSGTTLFAGTNGGGVFRSTDNGQHWTASSSGLTNPVVIALTVSGPNLFAGTIGGGVFLSTNAGAAWTSVNSGLTNPDVRELVVAGTNLFAGTNGSGVWRRPLSDVVATVQNPSTGLPIRFGLDQNFPNPFNPTTTIPYGINHPGHVSLKVYNMIGQEVATVLDASQPAGHYSVTFDAGTLSSGVYFYRLQTSGLTETRRMVVLR